MWAGREETSALFGFLAGLHPVVTELVLLCNGAFPGRGFPPLLLLGPQFLQLSSHSIYIYAPSKGLCMLLKNLIFERRAALYKCSLLFLDICEQQQNEQISEPLVLVKFSVSSNKEGKFLRVAVWMKEKEVWLQCYPPVHQAHGHAHTHA